MVVERSSAVRADNASCSPQHATDASIVKMGLMKTTVTVDAVTGVISVIMATAYLNGSAVMGKQGIVPSMKMKLDVVRDKNVQSRFQPFALFHNLSIYLGLLTFGKPL